MQTSRLVFTLAISAPLVAGLAACGSSDTAAPRSAVPTVDTVIAAFATLGVLTSDSAFNGSDTTILYGVEQNYADQFVGWGYSPGSPITSMWVRAIMRFTLPTLPGLGVVDSARVTVWQCGAVAYTSTGGFFDAYAQGHVQLDHVTLPNLLISDSTAYYGALDADIGTIASDSSVGLKSLAVSAAVKADYTAKRSSSDYRLNWIFDTPPSTTSGYAEDDAELGSDCGLTSGPGPFLIVWSH